MVDPVGGPAGVRVPTDRGSGRRHSTRARSGGGEPKTGKNRDHPDLVAADGAVEAEVARLLALGANRADVGQKGDEGFTVLADPEGNEFCLLHRR